MDDTWDGYEIPYFLPTSSVRPTDHVVVTMEISWNYFFFYLALLLVYGRKNSLAISLHSYVTRTKTLHIGSSLGTAHFDECLDLS